MDFSLCRRIVEHVAKVVVGKESKIELLLVGLLSEGHVLLEDLPGSGKTIMAKALARSIGGSFKRIQFTPDLLPSDVTGFTLFDQKTGEFRFQTGPVMANVLLADEINRTIPRTQSSLLESMGERQVTVDSRTLPLPRPFFVIATQNPVEFRGTFPLPEAQMDRFLMKISVDYPQSDAELEIVRLLQAEEGQQGPELQMIPQSHVFAAREVIQQMQIAPAVKHYIVDLVMATRQPEKYGDKLGLWVDTGSSPRASISLHRASRASAWLDGRDCVTPDDVRSVLHSVMRHRLIMSYDALADHITPDIIIDEIIRQVAVG